MTIFSEGCDSIVESMYMNASLSPYLSKSDYVVNPTTDKFYNKSILVTMPLSADLLKMLSRNSNRIISRFKLDVDIPYKLIPYDQGKKLNIKPFVSSKNNYSRFFYKNIKCIKLGDTLYIEKSSITDKEVNGDLTFLGLISNYEIE